MTQPSDTRPGRTRFLTIASIVAVGVAGAFAIGANIGILDAAGSDNVGELSAAGDLTALEPTTPEPQVVDVYLDGAAGTTATPVPAAGEEAYTVDTAGVATVAPTDTGGLRLVSVAPNPTWRWTLTQSDPAQLLVSFTDGARTLEFTATRGADGLIAVEVVDVTASGGSPTKASGSSRDHDDHDDDHERTEHDGGDDDD